MVPRSRPREVDAAERAFRIKTGSWSLAGGAIGAAIGYWRLGPAGILRGAPLGFALVFFTARFASGAAGRAFSAMVYGGSGDSTPHPREYSLPQSLALRGRYDEAIQAYRQFCAEFPEDPEPYVRIARLYRDDLERYEDAVTWFKRARAEAKTPPGLELIVSQEIIEIFTGKLGEPRRAIPELARLAERFAGRPEATWARGRMAEIRTALHQP